MEKEAIEVMKKILKDSIMVLNQIQDVQLLGIGNEGKKIMRNNIINCKRKEYESKIKELEQIGK